MLNQPHGCPDWDFMWIRPGDPEMECCTCEPPGPCFICKAENARMRDIGSASRLVCDDCYKAVFVHVGCGGWE